MQKFNKVKQTLMLVGLMLITLWCAASDNVLADGYNGITIQQGGAYQTPRGSTIQASIDGHMLTVVFTENLGQVAVDVSTVLGTSVHYSLVPTPNGFQLFITNTGDYIITFTLPNGDEYYGEFTVTD